MTDRELIELLWPLAAMRYMLHDGVIHHDKGVSFAAVISDIDTAQAELLVTAGRQSAGPKLGRRCYRAMEAVINPIADRNIDVGIAALAVFRLIQALVETGYITFSDGTAVDRAIRSYILAVEHHAECVGRLVSADIVARDMLEILHGHGLYRGLDL